MKAFTYRLQRVLDAREAATSRCETQLAQSERELAAFRGEQENCQQVLHQCTSAQLEVTTKTTLSAGEHRLQLAWKHHLTDRLDHAIHAVSRQIVTVTKRREDLKKALIEKKVMESLSKRERQAWLEKIGKLEQNIQDEQACIAYSRRKDSHAVISRDGRVTHQEIHI